jgi:uncharacterized phage-like protein YoqJ
MILSESQNKIVCGEKEKRVAITGHRTLESDFNEQILYDLLLKVCDQYDTFLIGMAVGFDSVCFRTLEKIRKEKNIKLVACVPCSDQSVRFSFSQKKEYERMIKSADQVIVLQDKYDFVCMHKRNKFMVDNASLLIAYKRKNTGGTVFTINYANEKNVPVIRI